MIIRISGRIKVENLLRCAHYVLWSSMLISIVGFFVVFFRSSEIEPLARGLTLVVEKGDSSEKYALIGQGPLSLHAGDLFSYIPHLSREIVILARNTRPDAQGKQAQLLLSLKGSNEQKMVNNGEKVYLNWESQEGLFSTLRFTDEPSLLWISPFIVDRCSTVIEVGMEEEKAQFVLEECQSVDVSPERPYFQALSEAKWWGIDALFQKYGGVEYKSVRSKQKLEFSSATSYTCLVDVGDFLVWEQGRWRALLCDESNADLPLAQVKSISARGLEMEAWDATGFYFTEIKLSCQHVPKINSKADYLPASLRLRTSSQVTCLLGKRRVILKQGDWLLRTATGWHILKRAEEIEDCLQHRAKGELLIFDQLDKEEGKTVFRGHLFDEMRTHMQPVVIPILGDKKTPRTLRKKKHVLSKKDKEVAAP